MQCTKTVKTAESTSDNAYPLNAEIFRPMILAVRLSQRELAGAQLLTALPRLSAGDRSSLSCGEQKPFPINAFNC